MALALSLGRRGMGRVWPNPAVGCVLVRDGVVLGRGWTGDGGRPHAETIALSQAGNAKEATAYVTLEPCAHHGKTPPCAQALIDAGVARVVIATGDPDPRVAGKGIAMLGSAGIPVDIGCRKAEADLDHQGFFQKVTQQRPFLTLKLASTLDGRIATHQGHSQWITSAQSRRVVHAMRARHDAVMVGAGTVEADDPMLNVRGMGTVPQPVRIVLSGKLDLRNGLHIAATAREQPVWLFHRPDVDPLRWQNRGADTFAQDPKDLRAVMVALAESGITRVFCEGGGTLGASLLQAGLVDELVVFTAGCAIGADGTPSLQAIGVDTMDDAPRFVRTGIQAVGPDVLTCWRPATPKD
ncbi:diaminohydroxyphosphoribosylaminopyrimidine deaminase / 5-amino-6-(5-phosphoribosylamino)uracil reductase [Cognatiyoonia koreensis]|uniref:Riboflavin biosynthesis protein RibD n=2 Tax=Cognatiyoonia koreensis TaxID=364200 RepID=A0A1I0NCB5_9RHOB|nr:diaminohydroxyphosphoribosylaminopyrimidine deaminase / 5-amino-6-(5-phosphoribosylamino)uracil reductase [Cognatiyoonia koreensis]